MNIIDNIACNGYNQSLIVKELANEAFFQEVYEYFRSFYQELENELKKEDPSLMVSFTAVEKWISSSNKAQCFVRKRVLNARGELIVRLFLDYYHFFVVLFETVEHNKTKFPNINADVLLGCYRCWIIAYMQNLCVPNHFFTLFSLAKPEDDIVFLEAVILTGIDRIVAEKICIDENLVMVIWNFLPNCSKKGKKQARKRLIKIIWRNDPSVKALLYRAKVIIPMPRWLFCSLIFLMSAVLTYILCRCIEF